MKISDLTPVSKILRRTMPQEVERFLFEVGLRMESWSAADAIRLESDGDKYRFVCTVLFFSEACTRDEVEHGDVRAVFKAIETAASRVRAVWDEQERLDAERDRLLDAAEAQANILAAPNITAGVAS